MFNMGEDMMKQWADNWEKLMGEHFEKLVHSEKFISEISKSVAATMTGKAMYSKTVDEQMAAMNLPTRTDLIKVMQKLTDIEERLIDLNEKFEDHVEAQAQGASASVASKPDAKTRQKAAEAKPKSDKGRKTKK